MDPETQDAMKITRSTVITGLAVLVLVAALPSAIREALETGRIYLFSWYVCAVGMAVSGHHEE